MINEITDLLEAAVNSILCSARARRLAARLRREKKPYTLAMTIGCSGCGHKPFMSFDDERRSYHLTCINPKCSAPVWTDTTKRDRDLAATVREWFEINGISSN